MQKVDCEAPVLMSIKVHVNMLPVLIVVTRGGSLVAFLIKFCIFR